MTAVSDLGVSGQARSGGEVVDSQTLQREQRKRVNRDVSQVQ